jgi:hypothetical protein
MHRGMRALVCAAAAFISPVATFAAAPVPVSIGKTILFKDWVAGCDNGLACQAVALIPESNPDQQLSVVFKRSEGGSAPLVIEIAGAQSKSPMYRILVDGKTASSGAISRDSDFVTVSGTAAIKLARSMSTGKAVAVIDGDGANLGSASLAGAAAALRYIDAQQGRAGTASAIVATGKRNAAAKTAALPVIAAKKITPTNMLPDASALVALSESSPCAVDRFGSTEDTAYSLGTGTKGPQALVMLNCGAGAYNQASGIYTGQRDNAGKWTFAPARFDYIATELGEKDKVPVLINSDWDAATQSITSYNKARGVGDCGSSESWVWDGAAFRLTAAAMMEECRGSLEWIPVWRADVKLNP